MTRKAPLKNQKRSGLLIDILAPIGSQMSGLDIVFASCDSPPPPNSFQGNTMDSVSNFIGQDGDNEDPTSLGAALKDAIASLSAPGRRTIPAYTDGRKLNVLCQDGQILVECPFGMGPTIKGRAQEAGLTPDGPQQKVDGLNMLVFRPAKQDGRPSFSLTGERKVGKELRLSPSLWSRIDKAAEAAGETRSDYLEKTLGKVFDLGQLLDDS